MAFFHGIKTQEAATSIASPVESTASLIVAVGTAPINLATEPAKVNSPVLCYQYAEFVKQFGYNSDFDKYTLCEVASSQFVLFNQAPAVFINVLNPAKHYTQKSANFSGVKSTAAKITAPVILSTVQVRAEQTPADPEDTPETILLVKDTDYSIALDDDSNTVITILNKNKVEEDTITVTYNELDPTKVTSEDIIGGVNSVTEQNEGLELVEEIFPKFRITTGTLICPKYSTDPAVAAEMKAKVQNINEVFKAIAIVDIPTSTVKNYTQAGEYKNSNNLVDENLIVCYPKVSLGGVQYHLSTQLACLMQQVDSDNGDIPYVSPSNKTLQCDSTVLADGTEKLFGLGQANLLNAQGIVTAMNFSNGFVAWGNRTSAYPASTDVKDCFIPVRRFFSWFSNNLILSYFREVDNPMNRRQIDTFVNSINIYLNGLKAAEVLYGGRIEFLDSENPKTDLLSGKIKFHVYLSPAIPAEDIEFVLEFDPQYLNELFS